MYSPVEDRSAMRLAMARKRERQEEQRRQRRVRLRFSVFLILFAMVAVGPRFFPEATGPLSEMIDEPPQELVGRWSTVDPAYADRALEIGTDVVALDMGPGLRQWYPILSTRSWEESGNTAYLITYETIGGDELEVEVHLYADGTLRLRNPSHMVWTRAPLTWQIRDVM